MECNLTKKELYEAKKNIRKEWKQFAKIYTNNPKIKTIRLVGSRATGRCRVDSDADFKILLNKIPKRLYINPKTKEKTEMTTDHSVVTVDFTRQLSDITIRPKVHIDPFIVYRSSDTKYWSPEGLR